MKDWLLDIVVGVTVGVILGVAGTMWACLKWCCSRTCNLGERHLGPRGGEAYYTGYFCSTCYHRLEEGKYL